MERGEGIVYKVPEGSIAQSFFTTWWLNFKDQEEEEEGS